MEQPPYHMAKWPYVTLCVPLPFFLYHLTSNERCNDSPLPSERTQICIPVCFKHLLRPHLDEIVLDWAAMWFPCSRAAGWRQSQRGFIGKRKGRRGMDMKEKGKDRRHWVRSSCSQSLTVTARATCFNLPPLRAAKCVYKPNDCILACFLPPWISVSASLNALLLCFQQERQRMRRREREKRIEEQCFPQKIMWGRITSNNSWNWNQTWSRENSDLRMNQRKDYLIIHFSCILLSWKPFGVADQIVDFLMMTCFIFDYIVPVCNSSHMNRIMNRPHMTTDIFVS